MRKVIVLGALSAIAEATCRMLAEEGASLALFGRDAARLAMVADDLRVRGAGNVLTDARDLAEAGDAEGALAAAAAAMGGVDAVLVFYGALGDQALAEADLTHARRIIDVNFTSAALWALAAVRVLAKMASTGRPVLVGVSSVAGDRGRRSNFVYGAAKGGFSTLLQGLAHREAARKGGVRVVAMKLGFVDTPMTAGLKKGGPLWASADAAGAAVRRAMDRGGPIVYAPWFWRWIMLAVRMAPAPLFNKVNL